jgi:hypothetical protein
VRRDKVPNPKSANTADKSLFAPGAVRFREDSNILRKKCVQLIEFSLRLMFLVVLVKE